MWIALRWMLQNLTNEKSTLVQVMAWCHQAPSHYQSQCCPWSMSVWYQFKHYLNWQLIVNSTFQNKLLNWIKEGNSNQNIEISELLSTKDLCVDMSFKPKRHDMSICVSFNKCDLCIFKICFWQENLCVNMMFIPKMSWHLGTCIHSCW